MWGRHPERWTKAAVVAVFASLGAGCSSEGETRERATSPRDSGAAEQQQAVGDASSGAVGSNGDCRSGRPTCTAVEACQLTSDGWQCVPGGEVDRDAAQGPIVDGSIDLTLDSDVGDALDSDVGDAMDVARPDASSALYTCDPVPQSSDAGASCLDQSDGGSPVVCAMTVAGTQYEGRCLPRCFAGTLPAAVFHGSESCGDTGTELCVPCYSPVDGNSTGACSVIPDDSPKDPWPTPLQPCGESIFFISRGSCTPLSIISEAGFPRELLDLLPQDVCDSGSLCVPKSKLSDPRSCFTRCATSVGPGTCLPAYIVDVFAPDQAGSLSSDDCASTEWCLPCISPLTGTSTGACAL